MSAVFAKNITKARVAFSDNITKNLDFRISQLKALYQLVDENKDILINALKEDLRRPSAETILGELEIVRNDIRDQLIHIKEYMEPKAVSKGISMIMNNVHIQYEPYGVALIIGAWNYPIQLVLCPLVGAITAGNCAIIKPSEEADKTAQTLAQLIPRYLNNECYHVITGGVDVTQELLKEKFDYIFFTGSTKVGRIVYEMAAKQLTPITLELGGKNPLYIDETVPNIEMAVRRILFGKFFNAGQTCVAPDYILCTPEIQQKFVESASKIIKEFYGEEPKDSNSFSRIINEKHFKRISKLISLRSEAIIGGNTDSSQNYISPTILVNISPNDPIMAEEIFGPVLPIVNISSTEEAIDFIKRREKPLTLYIFSTNKNTMSKFIQQTSSGAVVGNNTLIHFTVDSLPFGGVGASGIGKYHGRFSFETFSHPKGVLISDFNPVLDKITGQLYPPFTYFKTKFIKILGQKRRDYTPKYWSQYLMFTLGMISVLVFKAFLN